MSSIPQNRKNDFPIFDYWKKQGKPLIYLDSAAMCQMPKSVVEAMAQHDQELHANVHRGIYELSERATEQYEHAREVVQKFVNARSAKEIVFTRNTTESINLVAYSLGKDILKEGDHILISRAEHHSNILPWQMLVQEQGIVLDVIDPDDEGKISLEKMTQALTSHTRLVSLSHISHVLGTINPVQEIGALLRARDILFFVDAAQSAAHLPIDVQKINCDFLGFSGHKMGGPTGVGVLYGREELLERLPPFLRGGGMIQEVSMHSASWAELPLKFEAGTPNVSGAIGLSAAIEYIQHIGFGEVRKIDEELTKTAFASLNRIPGLRIFGPSNHVKRGGVMSFSIDDLHPVRGIASNGVHPHDLATLLDRHRICVRAGHHCAMPLMAHLGVSATTRVSFWIYNTPEDMNRLTEGIEQASHLLMRPTA